MKINWPFKHSQGCSGSLSLSTKGFWLYPVAQQGELLTVSLCPVCAACVPVVNFSFFKLSSTTFVKILLMPESTFLIRVISGRNTLDVSFRKNGPLSFGAGIWIRTFALVDFLLQHV